MEVDNEGSERRVLLQTVVTASATVNACPRAHARRYRCAMLVDAVEVRAIREDVLLIRCDG